jgi:hypothetical protein
MELGISNRRLMKAMIASLRETELLTQLLNRSKGLDSGVMFYNYSTLKFKVDKEKNRRSPFYIKYFEMQSK